MQQFLCSASRAEVVCRAQWQLSESTPSLQTRKGFSTGTGPDGSPIKRRYAPSHTACCILQSGAMGTSRSDPILLGCSRHKFPVAAIALESDIQCNPPLPKAPRTGLGGHGPIGSKTGQPMLLRIAQERHVERRSSHAVEMAAALLAVPAVPPCPAQQATSCAMAVFRSSVHRAEQQSCPSVTALTLENSRDCSQSSLHIFSGL